MIAAATKQDDPGFSAVIAGLKSITLQVFPLKGVDADVGEDQDRRRSSAGSRAAAGRLDQGARQGGGDLRLPQAGGRPDRRADPALGQPRRRGGGDQHRRHGSIRPRSAASARSFDLPQLQKIPAPGGAKKPKAGMNRSRPRRSPMNDTPLFSFAALLSAAALLAGCGGSPSVEEVHRELQRRFPQARFEPEEHVHLGRISLGLLHGLVRLASRRRATTGKGDDRLRDRRRRLRELQGPQPPRPRRPRREAPASRASSPSPAGR